LKNGVIWKNKAAHIAYLRRCQVDMKNAGIDEGD
jgi:hypothetical protein